MKVDYYHNGLLKVCLTNEEIDSISQHVNLDDFGIELIEGVNILEKETLWLILCELNNLQYQNKFIFDIVLKLKRFLYRGFK